MQKISSSNAKWIIIKFILKIMLTTVSSLFILSAISSFIILKLDLSLNMTEYLSVVICGICAAILPFISLIGVKYNQLVLSFMSVLPLAFVSIINFCINDSNYIIFIIKIILYVLFPFAIAYLKVRRK